MNTKIDYEILENYVDKVIMGPFHEKRLERLNQLKLKDILKRKNPYLFKAKNIETSGDFIKYLLDAFLSSQEETIFGNLMENLAIYICKVVYDGKKAEESKYRSLDLIFEKENKTYIVGIKSGVYWGNSDQINRMKNNFKTAKTLLREEGVVNEIIAVNGCMYGRDSKPFKDNEDRDKSYFKYCGQLFWEFISGDSDLYKRIIIPIDKEAKKRDESFKLIYTGKTNEMIKQFSEDFLNNEGLINWEKIIDYVSKNNQN
jgi:hypothetical protein